MFSSSTKDEEGVLRRPLSVHYGKSSISSSFKGVLLNAEGSERGPQGWAPW